MLAKIRSAACRIGKVSPSAIRTGDHRPFGLVPGSKIAQLSLALSLLVSAISIPVSAATFTIPKDPLPARVQPFCGVALWDDHDQVASPGIQLEFSYIPYQSVATDADPEQWSWQILEDKLAAAAARQHQMIFRFYLVYPGEVPARVPAFVSATAGYSAQTGESEGKQTGFPDWSHPALQDFLITFQERLAARYDRDPRLAYIQVGFGLWAEYHIYDGPFVLGKTFPDFTYQHRFLAAMANAWRETPWMISIDAATPEISPIVGDPTLMDLPFGCFDDSFLCKQHAKENAPNWAALKINRWQQHPAGGELSYYNNRDQRLAFSEEGPHGEPFITAAARFHLSFIIGNDQPKHVGIERVREVGMTLGYAFVIAEATSDGSAVTLVVRNDGIAPLYMDAWPALGSQRSAQSLKGLQPGEQRRFVIPAQDGEFHIACDRLVAGQHIGYRVATP
jgi:hypothetical protein